MSMHIVDQLARLAANAAPPPIDETTTRRLVDRALAAPRRSSAPAPERRAHAWFPASAMALVVAALAVVWLRPAPRAARPELLHVALPTGDQLVGTQQARFDVERVERSDRRVRLRAGTLLAEVAHVVPGQRFAIATTHLVATARGTIFSVEADAERTRVRVFEGIVEIAQDGESHTLAAGTMWTSDAHVLAITPARPPALAADIEEAVGRRELERRELVGATPAGTVAAPAAAIAKRAAPAEPAVSRFAPVAAPTEPAQVRMPVEPSLDDLLTRARAALAAGKLEDALASAKLAAARGATTGAWRIVTADALRGLGRAAEAVDAFEAAARALDGADAFEAGYSAAYLALHDVHDPDRALVALVTARVDAADSPLEERGLALHVRILEALHREADAAPIAARYLERYPHGELRASMQALATRAR